MNHGLITCDLKSEEDIVVSYNIENCLLVQLYDHSMCEFAHTLRCLINVTSLMGDVAI